MPIKLNDTYLGQGACRTEAAAFLPLLRDADEKIRNKSGAGNDYVGWIDLPVDYDREEVARIKKTAAAIQAHSDIFVVIGIGGSYLGAKAAIDFLRSPNYNTIRKRTPDIYFIGNSFSGSEIHLALRGQGRFGQRRFQVGHDDRKRHRLPRDAVLYAEPLFQGRAAPPHFCHHRCAHRRAQAACRRKRL